MGGDGRGNPRRGRETWGKRRVAREREVAERFGFEFGVVACGGGVRTAMAARLELSLPAVLRLQLLADMDAVAREGRSVSLPRRPCVREVLARYVELRTPRTKTKVDACVAEVVEGLLRYFDEALPRVLLYAEEKLLHAQWMVSGTKPSEVYGAEHFLRLFVRLPDLLPYHRLDPASQDLLQERLQDVLHYLSKHRAKCFAIAPSSRPSGLDPSPTDLHRTDVGLNPDVFPSVSVREGGAFGSSLPDGRT